MLIDLWRCHVVRSMPETCPIYLVSAKDTRDNKRGILSVASGIQAIEGTVLIT